MFKATRSAARLSPLRVTICAYSPRQSWVADVNAYRKPRLTIPVYITPAARTDKLPDSTFFADVVARNITDPPLTRWV
jgi:hypothetical protein